LRRIARTGYKGGVGLLGTDIDRAVALASEAGTVAFAAAVAAVAQPGDLIALGGELGSGKTSFARAFIRALGSEDEVPSQTFTLVQTYETATGMVWHFDLYRLERPEEVYELGFEEALIDGIALVEWPDRLGALLPRRRLAIDFAPGVAPTERRVRLKGDSSWGARLRGRLDG